MTSWRQFPVGKVTRSENGRKTGRDQPGKMYSSILKTNLDFYLEKELMFYWKLTILLSTVPLIKNTNRFHERSAQGRDILFFNRATKELFWLLNYSTSPEGYNVPKT